MIAVYNPIENLGTLLCHNADQFSLEQEDVLLQDATLPQLPEEDMPIDLYALACTMLNQR